jgi:CHAT domain-containing protein
MVTWGFAIQAKDDSLSSYRELIDAARLEDAVGNYAEAEDNYRKALVLQQSSPGDGDAAIGETMMSLALEISNQGRFDESGDLFKAAESLIQKLVDPIDQARLVSYLALDAANRHSFVEARDLARRATEERRGLIDSEGSATLDRRHSHDMVNGYLARGELVQSRLLEAAMNLRLGELGNAGEAAAEALEITQSIPGLPNWWRAEAMSLMGEIEGKLGHAQAAESLLSESVTLFRRLFGEARPTALALLSLGRFHAEYGRYSEAMQDFQLGLTILAKLGRNEGLLSFDTVSSYFTTAIDVADHDPAHHDELLSELFIVLQSVQKGKESEIASRSFVRLAESNPLVADLLRDLQDAERIRDQMRLSLASEASKPAESRDAERESWLAEQYRAASAKAERVDAGLKENVPEFRRLSHPGLVSLKELQAVLQPGETFATFAFGEEFGLVIAVSAKSVEAKRLTVSVKEVDEQVRELREGIIVRAGRVGRYDLNLAYQLYRKMLLPVQATLSDSSHLVVATSGALASLPLGALVTQVPQNDDLTKAVWLIKKTDISQMPSAAAFLALRRQVAPSKALRPFLGLGNPRFAGGGNGFSVILSHCGDGNPIPPEILSQLPPLPDTEAEVRNVAKALGATEQDLLLDSGATEQALRARPLNQYRILYFATHGLLPAELRCQAEPALALSPPMHPAQSKAEDGLLEASEIAGLKLDADLVVLSACNTATVSGKFGGETLASLSDAFFYAGSRGVLATHWSVPSSSTAKLMTRLFESHTTNPTTSYAAALRQAQLSLLTDQQTAHPLHWAGFSLIGGTIASSSSPVTGVPK